MISKSIVVSLLVLFGTTVGFAQTGMMSSGMMKGVKDSDTSGRQGCPEMGSGMMGSGMMKKTGSGMMGNMMDSGMMKGCQGMMASPKGADDIQALINYQDELGLTDEQITALKSIRSSLKKETIRRKAELQIAEMDLDSLLNGKGVKISSVESKLKQIQKLRTEIQLSRIKAQFQARDLLSDEQQKLWELEK